MTQPQPPRRQLRDLDEQALWAAIALAGAALFLAWQLVRHHPLALAGGLLSAVALTLAGLRGRALIADGLARRGDPPGPGVIVGRVTGTWRAARPRPFVLPWRCFTRHVLIVGPTGSGKSHSFIDPILRAHVKRTDAGVFYLDGKGSRADLPDPQSGRPGVEFEHVFCPQDPARSARWNPLGGPDPTAAAARFAAALYPEAGQAEQYYAASAAFVIKTVAPAMAYTGHGITKLSSVRAHEVLVAELVGHGVSEELADGLARNGAETERQLHLLPYRGDTDPQGIAELIRRKAAPAADWPQAAQWPRPAQVTIADLSALVFADDQLSALRDAVKTLSDKVKHTPRAALLDQLHSSLCALLAMPARSRAEVLSNLRNRLGWFLSPPFLDLCSGSDFDITDVTAGRSIAFLLPAGRFPDVAGPLGRIALAQFTQAVLSSTPEVTKLAVLDEFHNFVSGDFAGFLNEARSRGGGAVMALQTIASLPFEDRDELLANPATVIVMPGCQPYDAEHFSRVFGAAPVEQRSYTYDAASAAVGPRRASVRIEEREQPRYTPTQVSEIPARHAIARLTDGKHTYGPLTIHVDHER